MPPAFNESAVFGASASSGRAAAPGRWQGANVALLAIAITVVTGLAAAPCPVVGAGLPPRPGTDREQKLHTAPLFRDGVVVPSRRPLPVWGWGTPGRTVVVAIGGQRRETRIAADGTWQVLLPALEPATRLTLSVTDAHDAIEHCDVAVADPDPLLATLRGGLVDPRATPETVALFHNLKCHSRRYTLVGQQDPDVSCTGEAAGTDIERITGSAPAVWGSDFMHITHQANDGAHNWFHEQETKIVRLAAAAYDRGMVNVFCWHFREPFEEKSFDAKEMPAKSRSKAFRSLLPGGEKHDWYRRKLAKIAAVVKAIKGRDGTVAPVIFRPFHEFDVGYRKRPVPPRLFTATYGKALADSDLEIAFMMFWRQGKLADKGGYFVPVPGCDTAADFLEFANGPRPVFLTGVRHLYSVTALQPLDR